MKYDSRIREEELKNRVASDFFQDYDCVNILGNVDFSVCIKDNTPSLFDNEFLAWGEAKRGVISDFKTSFVQLILTVGKERTFDQYLPPRFLCEFDAKQIAFLPYDKILEVFYWNDFNWNITPSNHDTREFTELYGMVGGILDSQSFIFDFDDDEKLLRTFIKNNFKVGIDDVSRAKITKNNFISIYNRWLESVKPTIQVNWDTLKNSGVIDADFYLADIMSKDNMPIKDKLQVLLMNDHYMLARHIDESGLFASKQAKFNDDGIAHARFWLKYVRPPKKEYQDFILNRRDLLVPQDIRERKGSYFTPRIWVDLAQQYLASVLGENWQDEYYVWDCCAGTGNLLAGLSNKYNIYASTLDKSDVDVIQERIRNGANLLSDHVFQFDFLNDGYIDGEHGLESKLASSNKLPDSLKDILLDPQKRKKLVIFQNCPYAEQGNRKVINDSSNTEQHKEKVAKTRCHDYYSAMVGPAVRDLYIQFLLREYDDIPGCKIANFSTLKFVCSQNTIKFRERWQAKYLGGFICDSSSFDNVKGHFPIGFTIWDTSIKEIISSIETDIQYDGLSGKKAFYSCSGEKMISDWLRKYYEKGSPEIIGYMALPGVSMQQNSGVYITSKPTESDIKQCKVASITPMNLDKFCIYSAVRRCIELSWLNNKDEFRSPNELCLQDEIFVSNCIIYSLFDNMIKSGDGSNHWIPFSEDEVNSRERFNSHFMYNYLHGHTSGTESNENFDGELPGFCERRIQERSLSTEASAVLDTGRELWRYYHSKPGINVNASLYDIRAYFQGFSPNKNGKYVMNTESSDAKYVELIGNLRLAMKTLAAKIEPKVYEYGFLKR